MNWAKYSPVLLIPLMIWGLVYGGFSCDARYAEKAAEAYMAGDYETAEKNFSKILEVGIKDNRKMANVYAFRSECWRHMGQYEKAVEDAEAAVRYGSITHGHYLRGVAMVAMGKTRPAIDDLSIAIKRLRDHGEEPPFDNVLIPALLLRGASLLALEDWPGSLEDCSAILAADVQEGLRYEVLFRRATALFMMGDYSRAVADCDVALQMGGEHGARLARIKGVSLTLEGRSQEAFEFLDAVIESGMVAGELDEFLMLRVSALIDLGRYDECLAALKSAIDRGGRLNEVYAMRCGLYEIMGEDEKGVADAAKAIELGEETEHVYMNRAVCLQRLGRMDEAQKDWNRAAELRPHSDLQHFFKGLAHAHNRQYSEAVACWRSGMDANERFKGRIQEDDEALTRLRTACDAAKSANANSEAFLVSGWLYLLADETDMAVRDLTKAVHLDGGNAEAKRLLDRATRKRGGLIEEKGKLRLGRVS